MEILLRYAFDVKDTSTAKLVLLALAETVAARLRKHEVRAELVSYGSALF